MTDVFDQATEREERDREAAIAAQRSRTAVLPDIGHCYFCGETHSDGRSFCDANGRDVSGERVPRLCIAPLPKAS